jgi:DNA-binding transcriptional ArsR family regulator
VRKQTRGALRAPLNEILGAEANVRLLRELVSERGRYLTPGELATRTDLTRAAVYRALDRLFNAGVVEYGATGGRRCRLHASHPLTRRLRQLFQSEAQRVIEVRNSLRSAVEKLSPPPISAWIEGPVATGHDQFGDPVVVGLLDTPANVDEHVEALQESTVDLQREQDVTIEVRGRTRADLGSLPPSDRADLAHAILLFGSPVEPFVAPEKYRQRNPPRSHRDLEYRSLVYASAIARRIRTEPELVDRARDWLRLRMERASESELRDLREWERILRATTPARLSRFLADTSERAVRLRQSNPFVGALSQQERQEILKGSRQ